MKSIITLFAIFLFISCAPSDDSKNYDTQNEQEILDYLNTHNLTAQKSNSGLYYIIKTEGTGRTPTSRSTVTVAYKGYFINGTVFDQSSTAGVSFNLQQVIKGFKEGLTYFKEGGTGTLIMPSRLAYGNEDTNTIPAGSVLLFDITLINVN